MFSVPSTIESVKIGARTSGVYSERSLFLLITTTLLGQYSSWLRSRVFVIQIQEDGDAKTIRKIQRHLQCDIIIYIKT